MPNWEGSNRKSRLPANWPELRREVLARDGHQCMHLRQDTGRLCLAQARDVDHIDSTTDDDRMTNLRSLCGYHHGVKSGREGGIASGVARRKKAQGAAPRHPGLLP